MSAKRSQHVFGISTAVLKDSYVDRGRLDEKLHLLLEREIHVAIRGASKSGKSWLRQQVIADPLVVQCRLGKTVIEVYREALGLLGISLVTSTTRGSSLSGTVEASTQAGTSLLAKAAAKFGLSGTIKAETSTQPLRHNISDLSFVCEIIRSSGKRLVIEDFHYLGKEERRSLAYDLKTMWDLKLYVVLVGVWTESNLLLHLNSELANRVREVSVTWNRADLAKILTQGGDALNVEFTNDVQDELTLNAYGNAGILQRLALDVLDAAGITERGRKLVKVDDVEQVHSAALFYAEELNGIYQEFARRVASGIRRRSNSTGIYSHILAVVLDVPDEELITGVDWHVIFDKSHRRESRIQQGNLKTALGNLQRLQVDEDGRGLVIDYADERVKVVDQQLLLYRKYATVSWPWEDMIRAADSAGEDYSLPLSDEE